MNIDDVDGDDSSVKRNNHLLFPGDIRGIIIGDSGCGKTRLLINMILKDWLDFDKLYVFGKALHQPIYKIMKKGFDEKLPKEVIFNLMHQIKEINKHNISSHTLIEECKKHIQCKNPVICEYFEYPEDVPDPKDFKTTNKNLIVFDDLMLSKKLNKCEDFYVRGRHNNINCFYLTQNYIEVPKHSIRQNTNFLCVFKQDDNNIRNLYRDHASRDMSIEEFKELCDKCWQEPYDFLVVDKTSKIYDGKYRYKLDNFYYPKKLNYKNGR
jgi:hypothetical protein